MLISYLFIDLDINECLKMNGGCDRHVPCTNTDGNRTCGDCPLGYSGSGYADCKGTSPHCFPPLSPLFSPALSCFMSQFLVSGLLTLAPVF